MEVEVVASEAAKRADEALDKLSEKTRAFRSQVKNDLTSMKAASDRVQSEVEQMANKYAAAQALLTCQEFERAVANAERLAAALEAIGRLSETKLSVAVFSGNKTSKPNED